MRCNFLMIAETSSLFHEVIYTLIFYVPIFFLEAFFLKGYVCLFSWGWKRCIRRIRGKWSRLYWYMKAGIIARNESGLYDLLVNPSW